MLRKFSTLLTVSAITLASLAACSEGGGDDGATQTGGTGGGSDDDDPATGGKTQTGGSDSGGAPSSGGTGSTAENRYTFDTALEGWEVQHIENIDTGLGGASSIAQLSFDESDGEPDEGSLKLEVPFSFTGGGPLTELAKVHIGVNLEEAQDLSGKTVTAVVKLTSAEVTTDGEGEPTETCPIGGKLYIKTSVNYDWADGGSTNLVLGEWTTVSLDVDTPSWSADDYEPTETLQIGFEFAPTNGAGCETGDVTLLVDTIKY